MATTKPIICVDFDGVIHSYTSGWHGADVISDPPVPGAMSWLWKLSSHFQIFIYSSRSRDPKGRAAMALYIKAQAAQALGKEKGEYLFTVLTFSAEKPPAFLTIDDRAICFEGKFDTLDPETLISFKPWNKRNG